MLELGALPLPFEAQAMPASPLQHGLWKRQGFSPWPGSVEFRDDGTVPLRRGSQEGDGMDGWVLGWQLGLGRVFPALPSAAEFHCQGIGQIAAVIVTLIAAVCVKSLGCVRLFVTPWTVAHQAPCPWDSPGKNTGVGCQFLLQGIFPTQGLNPGVLHCRQTLY